jgi:hypothetical protein
MDRMSNWRHYSCDAFHTCGNKCGRKQIISHKPTTYTFKNSEHVQSDVSLDKKQTEKNQITFTILEPKYETKTQAN